MEKSSINERVVALLTHLVTSGRVHNKAQLADALNISRSKFTEIIKLRMNVGTEDISHLCLLYHANADWMLTGRGTMFTHAADAPRPVPSDRIIHCSNDTDPKLPNTVIPLYNINAAAGLNTLFADGGEVIGNISVPDMPLCDGAVNVVGDSMYPLLKPGDIIAYKILNSLNLLIYGEIYLVQLVHDGDIQIVVKYVKRSPRGTDHVSLVSLNKDYDPLEVPLTWIHLIARVSFAIRRFTF